MALVCPSCDALPGDDTTSCPSCGAKLVRVDDSDPLIGVTLDGRFKITERLGAGAMGVVYRAIQLSIGRDVAVKVMSGLDVIAVKRFFREAQVASALSHPNTVQIIEFGQGPDGRVYLAMELVRGHTLLDELTHAGAFATRRICHIGVQLCDALEAAHRLTIVHRDLKPENVMIATDGTDHVKILDFGIARVLGDAASRVTSAGMSAGTPNYMAPEVLGQGVDPEPPHDMYAVGVLLAELSLGHALWSRTTLEMLYVEKTTNAAVDAVPARLRPLVMRLLDADPALRPTAAAARKALRELERTTTDPVGVAATEAPMPPVAVAKPALDAALPPIDLGALVELDVVDLGVATGAPDVSPTQATAVLPPLAPSAPDARPDSFDVPPPEPKLELEGAWRHEKTARAAGKVATSPLAARFIREEVATRRHNRGITFALVLFLAIAGAGTFLFLRARDSSSPVTPPPPVGLERDGRASTIPPVSTPTPVEPRPQPPVAEDRVPDRGVSIRIIGAAGTPITIDGANAGKTPLSLKRSASKRTLTIRANGKTFKIIPDRDRTVDISRD